MIFPEYPTDKYSRIVEPKEKGQKNKQPFWVFPDTIPFPFVLKESCKICNVNEYLATFIPRHFTETLKLANTTCAIVTHEKKLTDYMFGDLIDSHDIVMRFNLHKLHHVESYGRKTTHMMMNDAVWNKHTRFYGKYHLLNEVSGVLIFNHFGFNWKLNNSFNRYQHNILPRILQFFITRKEKLNETFILDPSFLTFVNFAFESVIKQPLKTLPTTGFVAIVPLAKLCKRVHSFGFIDPAPIFWHDIKNEHKLLRKWSLDKTAKVKLKMFP